MNRNVGIVLTVLIVALVGGVAVVSGKLTGARVEIARLQAALHTRQTPAGQVQAAAMMVGVLRPVSNVTVRVPGEATVVAPAAAPVVASKEDATNASPGVAGNAVAGAGALNAPATVAEKPIPESDLARAIEVMSEVWRSRRIELENTTIATLGLNAEQGETFRKIMFDMNGWLRPRVDEWTNRLESGSVKVTEESCVRVVNDLSGFILLAYQEMDRRFGVGWRSKAPKGFTLTDFIDPSIGMPMVAAQRLLRDRQ